MIEVVLKKSSHILSFDGRVLEDFFNKLRIHVRYVKEVRIKEGRKGVHQLHVVAVTGAIVARFDDSERAGVEQLAAELNAAIG